MFTDWTAGGAEVSVGWWKAWLHAAHCRPRGSFASG